MQELEKKKRTHVRGTLGVGRQEQQDTGTMKGQFEKVVTGTVWGRGS